MIQHMECVKIAGNLIWLLPHHFKFLDPEQDTLNECFVNIFGTSHTFYILCVKWKYLLFEELGFNVDFVVDSLWKIWYV